MGPNVRNPNPVVVRYRCLVKKREREREHERTHVYTFLGVAYLRESAQLNLTHCTMGICCLF